jgi:hypothetical protein
MLLSALLALSFISCFVILPFQPNTHHVDEGNNASARLLELRVGTKSGKGREKRSSSA